MQRSIHNQAKQYLRRHRKWKKWKNIVLSLACVVVFCTVYALILPAITAGTNTSCGKEEHAHGDECYESKLGARGIRTIFEIILKDAMFSAPGKRKKFIVSETTVKHTLKLNDEHSYIII